MRESSILPDAIETRHFDDKGLGELDQIPEGNFFDDNSEEKLGTTLLTAEAILCPLTTFSCVNHA